MRLLVGRGFQRNEFPKESEDDNPRDEILNDENPKGISNVNNRVKDGDENRHLVYALSLC